MRNIFNYVDTGFYSLEQFMNDPNSKARLPSFFQLDLRGLSQLFREGKFPELDHIISQLDKEYQWLGRRGLWWRVIGTFQQIVYKVHVFNTDPNGKKLFEMESHPPINLSNIEPPE